MQNKWYQKVWTWITNKDNLREKWYKRRVVWILISVIIAFSVVFASCGKTSGKNEIKGNKIPNVFGIYYEDAIDVLEAEGFEVKAIETNVKSISDKLLYPLESSDKGSVFKIDDYILDGNGYLTLNYDILYDEAMVSEDKSIIIYYAKEEYVSENAVVPKEDNTQVSIEPEIPVQDKTETKGIRPDFKASLDSYEKFFSEYVAIMKKYANNPTDLSILTDYTRYMSEYVDMMEKFEALEDDDLTVDEVAYYLEVQGRITKKLLEIAQ